MSKEDAIEVEPVCGREPSAARREPAGEILSEAKDLGAQNRSR